MKIDLYTQVRNEEKLMPYFLRHYETFVDNIFIIDDKSTDKTVEIAKKNSKVKILKPNYKIDFDEITRNNYFEDIYKKYSRKDTDWVIYVDGDEFIYHKNILKVLKEQQERKRKLIKVNGYAMISRKFPTTNKQIYKECNIGVRTRYYDKVIIFNPKIDLKFTIGRHLPPITKENFKSDRCGILLLHYRYLSEKFIVERWDCSTRNHSKKTVNRRIRKDLARFKEYLKDATKII